MQTQPYVLVIGEALVDVVHTRDGEVREHPGGSAANVAVALSRLGRSVRFATAYASDPYGDLIAAHLQASGVAYAGDPLILERTSSATATIGTDGAASYVFDLDWRLGPVPLDPMPTAVHVCSLGAVLEPGATQVAELLSDLDPSVTVSYDINARPAVTGTGPETVAAVERIARHAHLVKASDEDLEALYPHLGLAESAAHLLGLGARAVAVTRGGAGASWFDQNGTVLVAARPVVVADTIGAGDTFGAALIDGLAAIDALGSGWPALTQPQIEQLLEHAVRCAAVTVSRPGADPPYRSELA